MCQATGRWSGRSTAHQRISAVVTEICSADNVACRRPNQRQVRGSDQIFNELPIKVPFVVRQCRPFGATLNRIKFDHAGVESHCKAIYSQSSRSSAMFPSLRPGKAMAKMQQPLPTRMPRSASANRVGPAVAEAHKVFDFGECFTALEELLAYAPLLVCSSRFSVSRFILIHYRASTFLIERFCRALVARIQGLRSKNTSSSSRRF
jgi:hypothetical protein